MAAREAASAAAVAEAVAEDAEIEARLAPSPLLVLVRVLAVAVGEERGEIEACIGAYTDTSSPSSAVSHTEEPRRDKLWMLPSLPVRLCCCCSLPMRLCCCCSLPVRLCCCCCCRWASTTTAGPPLPPEENGVTPTEEAELGGCSADGLIGAEEEKSMEESPPSEPPEPPPPAARREVPPVSDIASDMLSSHLCGAPPPLLRMTRRGVAADVAAAAPPVLSATSSGEEPPREPLMSGEYAGGGVSDGSRRGEYAGPLTTAATTTGVRPAAAAAARAEEDEEAAEEAGLSFASATSMSMSLVSLLSCCRCFCRVGVRVAVAAITAAPVAAPAAAPAAADAAVRAVPPDENSCEASWTGGSCGIGEERRLRGEDSGDRSKESVLGLLLMREMPMRLDPPGLLVVVLLLVDVGWPPPLLWNIIGPLPVETRAGGTREVSCWDSCWDGTDWSDPEDSERSVASMGLMLRTPTVEENAAAATPAAAPAPAPPATPAVATSELVAESNDPGSTCTMTVPSALEETWLPTWLPSVTTEEVPASE